MEGDPLNAGGAHALQPAAGVPPERLHAAFVLAFADYLAGPFLLGLEQWPAFLARQGIDLSLSRVASGGDGAPLAFALVAPRPALRRWRLATMGALPAARGSGAAPALLQDLAARAQAAGQVALELEVFAENARAVNLYERHGFARRAALFGHVATGGGEAGDAGIATVARDDALAWLDAAQAQLEARDDELPLQVTAPVLAVAEGWTAWRRGSAQLVFGDAPDGGLLIRSLVDTRPAQHDAEALARALRAAHPGRRIEQPPLLRPDVGGAALARAGFVPLPLHQWLMRRRLDAGSAMPPRA